MRLSSKPTTFVIAFLVTVFLLFGPCAPRLEDGRSNAAGERPSARDETSQERVRKIEAPVSSQSLDSQQGNESP